ncbi:MAG: DNA polymerase III [Candidatus Dactylopiibacterium carminicum]|uniref:Type-4 uracil-DNA glycosylase n=1 Tax=Candidatus Dactylopiibacterium carminicum TaxID=857335 RepID=A0A272EUS2_9RHOO|nr:uracil-DNA glycosylase [Candidatus Dactylopiibacterium carminicum]KAF7600328.1 DNA polymerase III [Candidatus Dactylopiibacterium carminicum]PAS93340.1 MAG: DNA polymerase III [Candidatus Dactylopiibacterium carminicum]PAS93844.1 MAG: DNA polymerase III [Candidatus Dactylopiibacterium carminicum]PAT00331.1 MAG: DNA polymerase III [Candidatus Dactylopiibacterium carminicum]
MTSQTLSVLAELGVKPLWRLRAHEEAAAPEAPAMAEAAVQPEPPGHRIAEPERPPRPAMVMPERQPASTPTVADAGLPLVPGLADMGWDDLAATVAACQRCGLCQRRKQTVLGVGDHQADWMLVGEGPGAEEDARGEPFVGAAGKLLDAMLAALGMQRGENVYIANAVKCRPPGNRTPEAAEIDACKPYLLRQIELVRPRLIVAMGRPAAQALLARELKIGAARGKVFHFGETPLVVTYHPAYLLRNPLDKARAWEDLCFAQAQLEALGPR